MGGPVPSFWCPVEKPFVPFKPQHRYGGNGQSRPQSLDLQSGHLKEGGELWDIQKGKEQSQGKPDDDREQPVPVVQALKNTVAERAVDQTQKYIGKNQG